MSGLLFGVGAVAVLLGVVTIGFGIPINEFSFGNTLIIAGTTAAVGGLIVVGLGVVVAQLQRLTEALAARAPIRASRPLEAFEPASGSRPAPARVPFPPKPKSEPIFRDEPYAPTPTLRNPDEPPVTVDDDISLSPLHPMAASAPAATDMDEPARHTPAFDFNEPETPDNRHEPSLDSGWRPATPPGAPVQSRQPHAYFDAMWPSEAQPAKNPAGKNPVETDAKPYEPNLDLPPRETSATPARRPEPEAPRPRPAPEARAVAILKSGVVDGMGYTLYVDGSIEAELSQGTLRFASINELRSHLEKNA